LMGRTEMEDLVQLQLVLMLVRRPRLLKPFLPYNW